MARSFIGGKAEPGARLLKQRLTRASALLVGAGALAASLVACGSSSSTASQQSSMSVVKKEAGLMHVDLTAINQTGRTIGGINLCDAGGAQEQGSCHFLGDPLHGAADGQSGSVQVDGTAEGDFRYLDRTAVEFEAGNPLVGEPYIQVTSGQDSSGHVSLSEGEVQTRTVNGHVLDLERRGDTAYKELGVIAKS